MTIPATNCEVKLHGFRRTADGVVVSFVVHPAEVPNALALDPLGTRYMLALAAIGDDETPIPPKDTAPWSNATKAPCRLNKSPDHCSRNGGDYICESCREEVKPGGATSAARDRYAVMSSREKALVRAGRLPRDDERFRAWVTSQLDLDSGGWSGEGLVSEERAAQYIRDRCCGGKSRRLIAEDPEAMDKFMAMETAFKIAVGEIPEPR